MALDKKPRWLSDMFGFFPGGHPLFLDCVRRTNPGRKRPGPVTIQLDCDFLPPQNISVFAADRLIDDPQTLEHLATRIAEQRRHGDTAGPSALLEEPGNGAARGPTAESALLGVPPSSEAVLDGRPFRLTFLPNNEVEVTLPGPFAECDPEELAVLLRAAARLEGHVWVIKRSPDRGGPAKYETRDERKTL